MIEICTVSGYEEIGSNMTAIRVDDDVIILDCGINIPNFIEANEHSARTADELIEFKAIPDINKIRDWIADVKAIIPSHAHLDHVGAIHHLEKRFMAPIIGTPFTIAVLDQICVNEKIHLKNVTKSLIYNRKFEITKKISIEFIEITHSVPHAAIVMIRTPYGNLVYANDFKMDHTPTLGNPPSIEKLTKLGEEGVDLMFAESTNILEEGRTDSESTAAKKVRQAMLDNADGGLIVSTFSSHIARVKVICETAKDMNRKVLFMGRSMSKYLNAAKQVELFDYEPFGELVPFKSMIRKRLKSIQNDLDKYVLLVTGHQGEPQAILSSMIRDELPCILSEEDTIILSCKVIPTQLTRNQREKLDAAIIERKIGLETDKHASGHPCKEDVKELLQLLKPKLVVPSHCTPEFREEMGVFSKSLGFEFKIMGDGDRLVVKQ